MIHVAFEGGLGNQMFQYAAGRYLEKKFHDNVVIDSSKYQCEAIEFRNYELNDFNVKKDWGTVRIQESRFKRFGSLYFVYLVWTGLYLKINKERYNSGRSLKFTKLYQFLTNRIGFYRMHFSETPCFYKSWTKRKYIRGMWFYPQIVLSLGEELKKELTVKTPISDKNQEFLDSINSTNSVAVHIRRGDYVKLGMVVCDIAYYQRCMEKMSKIVDSPVFFVFSDDIDWVKENLSTDGYTVIFVNNNNGATDDMRLVYSCKHFIMSNSTFSWWGAYLGSAEDKKVIVPEIWAKGAKRSNLILDSWITEKTL